MGASGAPRVGGSFASTGIDDACVPCRRHQALGIRPQASGPQTSETQASGPAHFGHPSRIVLTAVTLSVRGCPNGCFLNYVSSPSPSFRIL